MPTVAIDAGHYKSHPGAVAAGIYEVNINRAVKDQLKGELIRQGFEYVDCIGKSKKVSTSAYEKALAANRAKADVYVSIHCNSSKLIYPYGCEIYHYPGSPQGLELAKLIYEEVVKSFDMKRRGIKIKKFIVLRKTRMPAVLLEWGFISNPAERHMMAQAYNQKRCAEAIMYGLLRFFGLKPKEHAPIQDQIDIQQDLARANEKLDKIRAIVG